MSDSATPRYLSRRSKSDIKEIAGSPEDEDGGILTRSSGMGRGLRSHKREKKHVDRHSSEEEQLVEKQQKDKKDKPKKPHKVLAKLKKNQGTEYQVNNAVAAAVVPGQSRNPFHSSNLCGVPVDSRARRGMGGMVKTKKVLGKKEAGKKGSGKKKKEEGDGPGGDGDSVSGVVFGVPLEEAVRQSRSYDGVQVPAVVRQCIDHVNRHGLSLEGVYRVSVQASQLDALREFVDRNPTAVVTFPDPHYAATLLKLFLRKLPSPIIPEHLTPYFEQTLSDSQRTQQDRILQVNQLLKSLPEMNRMLLSYVFLHMDRVMSNAGENKMTLRNVGLVLWQTLNIDQNLLGFLLENIRSLFGGVTVKEYRPPLPTPKFGRLALDLPKSASAIEEELKKQESLLEHLHSEASKGQNKDDELWNVQLIVTQLRRKFKQVTKDRDGGGVSADEMAPSIEIFEEKHLWATQKLLRERIAKEILEINRMKSAPREEEKEVVEEGDDDLTEEEYLALEKQLIARREELVQSIIDERNAIARVQAELEMNSLRLSHRAVENTRL